MSSPAWGTSTTASVRPARLLARGLTKRCAVCGGGHLYDGWFKMKARCPRCGYQFAREEGFFLGAVVVNFAVAEGLMALLCIVPSIYLFATRPDASVWPLLGGGLIAAVVAPIVLYPFSKTTWVALELTLRPAATTEPSDVS